MFPHPDVSTLRLCSVLAGMAFGLVFAGLWARRRSDTYLLYWAASSGGYAAVLMAFELVAAPAGAFVGGLLFAGLTGTTLMLLPGVRAFDGRTPLCWWIALPLALSSLGYAVPVLLQGWGLIEGGYAIGRTWGLLGLVVASAVTGGVLLGGRREGISGDRIAGAAVLAYVPVSLLAMAGEFAGAYHLNLFAMLAMLADQILLPIIYLGLLAMPGQRAQQILRELAHRDPLTGAWNRAALHAHDRRVARVGNAVILVDIDHFKQINDHNGHGAGDAVLRTLALRMTDIAVLQGGNLVRLGGDEFMLIVRASLAEAGLIAEQVRSAAALKTLGLPPCTVSLGVAEIRQDAGLAEAMGRADRSLYLAKAAGRNRVAA